MTNTCLIPDGGEQVLFTCEECGDEYVRSPGQSLECPECGFDPVEHYK